MLFDKIKKLAEDILNMNSNPNRDEYWKCYDHYYQAKKDLKYLQKSFDKSEKSLIRLIRNYDKAIEKGISISKEKLNKKLENLIDDHLHENLQLTTIVNSSYSNLEKAIDFLTKEEDMLYKKYMNNSLNRKRERMPQIKGDNMDSVLLHFAQNSSGASVAKKKMKLGKIKPAQNEMNESKIKKILRKSPKTINNPFLLSKDGYLMDGHHRWAADLQRYGEDHEANVYQITLDANDLLKRLNQLKHSYKEDVVGIKKGEENSNKTYAVAMIYNGDKILFVKRSLDDNFHPGTWSLPGGGVEEGESPTEAVVREVKEELNLQLKKETCYLVEKIKTGENSTIHYYQCSINYGGDNHQSLIALLDGENIQYQFMDSDEWGSENLILDLAKHLDYIMSNDGRDEKEAKLIKAIDIMEDAYREDLISADIYINEYKPQIQQILSSLLEKASTAKIGEKRKLADRQYEKTQSGWTKVKKYTQGELSNYAKNSAESDLKKTIATSPDETLRDAAKKELSRRDKEEGLIEEKTNDKEKV